MFINVSTWCCFMFLNFILVLYFSYILQIFSSFSIQKYVHLVAIIFVNSKALDAMIQLFGVMNYSFFFFCWLDRFYGTFVTQRELAGPVTCLAHWILFNGSVLCSVSCSVPLPIYLHTLLYTALFVTACPKSPYFTAQKNNTAVVDLLDRVRSFLDSSLTERRYAGTIDEDREIKTVQPKLRISQKLQKKETKKKEWKNAHFLSEGRYLPNKNKKYINAQQQQQQRRQQLQQQEQHLQQQQQQQQHEQQQHQQQHRHWPIQHQEQQQQQATTCQHVRTAFDGTSGRNYTFFLHNRSCPPVFAHLSLRPGQFYRYIIKKYELEGAPRYRPW